ncbi:hypothetical protein UFOVP557_10 [uncultured Caudovirales phage]|uniref:Uncharacterized protein n=1 Tax=uncultured Caudovirales phage TaxID=2100421 RepID=A0A6J5MS43_9CAUD|nr:hypothetical protein UFOVP557_10 [uncultured Caudovirales phage]
MICGDSSTAERLSFQMVNGGAIPTSPLQFTIEVIDVHTACRLNALWHSRLPIIEWSNVVRNKHSICFGARFNGDLYAVAIWSSPVAANRMKNGREALELRRFAIAPDAPKNTGSRMLSVMRSIIKSRMPDVSWFVSYQDTEVHAGTIYKASGWKLIGESLGVSWSNKNRVRNKEQSMATKARWELQIRPTLNQTDKTKAVAIDELFAMSSI